MVLSQKEKFLCEENSNEKVTAHTNSIQTAKSPSKWWIRKTSSVKFLKRALSSSTRSILWVKRSQKSKKSGCDNNSRTSCDKDTSEGSCDTELNPKSPRRRIKSVKNDCCDLNTIERTKIVPESFIPLEKINNHNTKSELNGCDNQPDKDITTNKINCATSIFHHSYLLESICGVPDNTNSKDLTIYGESNHKLPRHSANTEKSIPRRISEDPTIQESIECIFASQLEEGLKLWDDEDDVDNANDDNDDNINNRMTLSSYGRHTQGSKRQRNSVDDILSPTDIQQSRMNRKDRKDSRGNIFSSNFSQTNKRYEQASLVYIGTFDPSCHNPKNMTNINFDAGNISASNDDNQFDPFPCRCATHFLPSLRPKKWPQAPIALIPTPGSNTRVKAIRFSNSKEFLWAPGSHLNWNQKLANHWGKVENKHYECCCEKCVICPINNGNEKKGESLVVDFESDLFEGSLLLRLRYTEGTTPEPFDDEKGYFKGMNRRYQACIRGRFKESIPMTSLVTGLRFNRKFGKMPSKWVLKGALKVISFFAPQLDTKLDVDRPASLSPLGSTPQSIIVDDNCRSRSSSEENGKKSLMTPLEDVRIEPLEAHRSILGESFKGETSLQRARMRKKLFDKLYVLKTKNPKTDPNKIYTFEFLQHLFNFQDFSIELGSMLGSVELEDMLDGQPLQIMAAHGDQPLWSFDLWHECLWERALYHDQQRSSK